MKLSKNKNKKAEGQEGIKKEERETDRQTELSLHV